jgi:hypothetical protein
MAFNVNFDVQRYERTVTVQSKAIVIKIVFLSVLCRVFHTVLSRKEIIQFWGRDATDCVTIGYEHNLIANLCTNVV